MNKYIIFCFIWLICYKLSLAQSSSASWYLEDVAACKSADELIAKYGANNVKRRVVITTGDPGDEEKVIATILYPNTPEQLTISWANSNTLSKIEFIKGEMYGIVNVSSKAYNKKPKWISKTGLKYGMPISEVISLNGTDFKLYGLEWDESGLLNSWAGGKLSKTKIGVYFGINWEAKIEESDLKTISGDKLYSSSLPAWQKYGVSIVQLNYRPRAQYDLNDYKKISLDNLASYNPPNKPANLAKTCSYAKMYLINPKLFKWAGLAALVSGRVGEESEKPLSVMSELVGFDMVKVILQGNEDVYKDLYWQHLLVQEEGLPGIERAYSEKAIKEKSYQGWVKILSAKNDNDIWEGNKDLLYYEQSEILQRNMYDKYSITWYNITNLAWARKSRLKTPIPPSKEQLFSENDLKDNLTSIGLLQDRWSLIQRKILPSWRAFESNPANKLILMQSLNKACPVLN